MNADQQRRLIVEQFTKQAVAFSQLPNHNNEETNRLVLETGQIGQEDTVLDVACGPGLISTAIARHARHVTGIDITPAMIEEARQRQISLDLTNMSWQIGDITRLPMADAQFSRVVTRYSFHHFLDPQSALREMARVCQPGGWCTVIDVFMSSTDQAELYNQMEKLRDPSHVRALQINEFPELFLNAGLLNFRTAYYKVEVELEQLLKATYTIPADAERIRSIFAADLKVDRMGVGSMVKSGQIFFSFPIMVFAGQKPNTER